MAIELQSELAMGAAELFELAYKMANEIKCDNNSLLYINNRRCYYSSCAYYKKKQLVEENFSRTGVGYGQQITYLRIAHNFLKFGGMNVINNYNLRQIMGII